MVQLFRKNNVPVEFRPIQPGLLSSVLSWLLPMLTLALIGVAALADLCEHEWSRFV